MDDQAGNQKSQLQLDIVLLRMEVGNIHKSVDGLQVILTDIRDELKKMNEREK